MLGGDGGGILSLVFRCPCYIQRPTPDVGAAKQDRQVRPSPSGLALKVQHPIPG